MRPESLFNLFKPLTTLPGIGPKLVKPITKLVGGERVIDLLFHLPISSVDRSARPKIAEAQLNTVVTLEVTVKTHRPGRTARQPYRVIVADETGELALVYFRGEAAWLEKLLPHGARRIISGRFEAYDGFAQMNHPDYVVAPEAADQIPPLEPVYPLTAGLSARQLSKAVQAACTLIPDLAEWLDPAYLARQGWPDWRRALLKIHNPEVAEDLQPDSPARHRLAFDELLANQLALGLVRHRLVHKRGRPIIGDGRLTEPLRAALPYHLTEGQDGAISEITTDLARPTRMLRLLQGDVGAGKTVVALFAMLTVIEAGHQACLMAPTDLLARQHAQTLSHLTVGLDVTLSVLTGRDGAQHRNRVGIGLIEGTINLMIGTHALLEGAVAFKSLALAVIDEQHRFGVDQRLALNAKTDQGLDVLVMSATPIPRSLTLAAFGDMDVSRLTGKPPGRKRIDTRVVPLGRRDEIVEAVMRAITDDARVYWVCPLVSESEALDVAAVEERYAMLQTRFGARVGILHGRMKGPEKDAAMAAFAAGETRILVATTVIEVGVDVPEASVMVIEHAERFGLAQLHQLRGRVGRGDRASFCLLLYAPETGETGHKRLETLRRTDDGFEIAEADLHIRGAGDLLGTKQAGMPRFRIADIDIHGDLLPTARDDARLIMACDPDLATPRGRQLRALLYLFERDAGIRYLASG